MLFSARSQYWWRFTSEKYYGSDGPSPWNIFKGFIKKSNLNCERLQVSVFENSTTRISRVFHRAYDCCIIITYCTRHKRPGYNVLDNHTREVRPHVDSLIQSDRIFCGESDASVLTPPEVPHGTLPARQQSTTKVNRTRHTMGGNAFTASCHASLLWDCYWSEKRTLTITKKKQTKKKQYP